MKNLFRTFLKNALGGISRRAIQKHNAEVIVVVGWTGSSTVREMIYHLLKESFNVRRNVTDVWWDLSVPLGVLGYEDKRRNVFEWISLIVRAYASIFIKPRHQHKIVINLDTSVEDTARFWSRYIVPDIVVVLKEKPDSKVLRMFRQKIGNEKFLFVHNPDLFSGFSDMQVREFVFGKKGDLSCSVTGEKLNLSYKQEKIDVKIPKNYPFFREFIPAALSVGILQGISLEELGKRITHFEMHPNQMKHAMSKLRSFIEKE